MACIWGIPCSIERDSNIFDSLHLKWSHPYPNGGQNIECEIKHITKVKIGWELKKEYGDEFCNRSNINSVDMIWLLPCCWANERKTRGKGIAQTQKWKTCCIHACTCQLNQVDLRVRACVCSEWQWNNNVNKMKLTESTERKKSERSRNRTNDTKMKWYKQQFGASN